MGPVMKARRITDFIWCEGCGEPHPWDPTERKVIVDSTHMCDQINDAYQTDVATLPSGWDRTHYAEYGSRAGRASGYVLTPLRVDPLPDHRPMFYSTEGT